MKSQPKTAASQPSQSRPGVRTRRRWLLLAAPLAVLVVVFALPSTPAFASAPGPPHFEAELREEAVYATRAHIALEVQSFGLELECEGFYATKESGPWIPSGNLKTEPVDNGFFPNGVSCFLGTDPGGGTLHVKALIRQLAPKTTYYAFFKAKNSEGSVESKIFSFTTTAASKPEISSFVTNYLGPKSAFARAHVEANGSETKYSFEYALGEDGHAPGESSPLWAPFASGETGTITLAGEFATPEATVTGLSPETTYYVRVKANNGVGETREELKSFTTPTARPLVGDIEGYVRNVTSTSAHVKDTVIPHGLETSWRFEYSTSVAGPWQVVPGADGVISQAEAEVLPEGVGASVEGGLANLSPGERYYVRLFAENEVGEGRNGLGEPIASEKQGLGSFDTFGAPFATTLAVHGFDGETLRVVGSVNPDSVPTSSEQIVTVKGTPAGGTFTLTFKGRTTAPIAYDAPAEDAGSVRSALEVLSTIGGDGGKVRVGGPNGGPYRVYFLGHDGEVEQPALSGDGSALTPSSEIGVTVVLRGGEGYDTHYHFEYVAQKQFEMPGVEGGFTMATATSEVDIGSGDTPEYFGADLPGLTAGESYRFRIVATNTSPGNPVVRGEEQVLTVPVTPGFASEGVSDCPNEALRIGPSALLPDCRAYEQLTPVDKGGTQEIFNYGGGLQNEGALPGEDGDHVEFGSLPVKWGTGPDPGQSPYFFSRGETGWQMTAGTAQPEAGIFHYTPQVFGTNFGEFAFESSYGTSPVGRPVDTEFKLGPPGGPYVTAASVPLSESEPGWVAASKDFSKLVLEVPDHTLLGHSTHTQEGTDLYEWSNGELRQLNVTGPAPGSTIGSCGARIPGGATQNPGANEGSHVTDSHNPVSEDGSLVFFEAVPSGGSCSGPKHLYTRVDGGNEGAHTVDLGAYRFLAADAQGSTVLLEKSEGENEGLYLYKSGSTPEFLASSGVAVGAGLVVSTDLSTVYVLSGEPKAQTVYRYDISDQTLLLVTKISVENSHKYYSTSGEGRYFYFIAGTVAGLPGGGQELEQPLATESGQTSQVYRYDSTEAVVQCISCSSSFDPEPKLGALFTLFSGSGESAASENGDYVFFDTPATLLPADIDGEVAPENNNSEHSSSDYSLSSDVYEWRRDGVGGCSHIQGCLALITSGHGGFLNILLGTSSSGHDVFFATHESLLTSDNDTTGDIYDARVGGGFAEAARPVECEGDACSTPFAPPSEITPSSASFHGASNPTPTTTPTSKAVKPKSKPKKKKTKRKKHKAKPKKKTRKASRVRRTKR